MSHHKSLLSRILGSLFLLQTTALAQDTATDISDLIPETYKNISRTKTDDAFGSTKHKSMCRNGLRMGNSLGKLFIKSLAPSCTDLLNNIGLEWSVPSKDYGSPTPFNICFASAYTVAIQKTVLETSKNCAIQLNEATVLASQLEYNRCYLEVAGSIGESEFEFASDSEFVTGEYVLVPKKSEKWNAFLDNFSGIVNAKGETSLTPQQILACKIGAQDAQTNLPPRKLFQNAKE
jgi:hypothetical protein